MLPPWILFLLLLTAGLPLGIWILHRTLRPLGEMLRALADGVRSLRDRDFSMRLAVRGRDELGELVSAYNEAVDALGEERTALRQRELLLETALHRSPLAIVLTDQRDRVIFANPEARPGLCPQRVHLVGRINAYLIKSKGDRDPSKRAHPREFGLVAGSRCGAPNRQ